MASQTNNQPPPLHYLMPIFPGFQLLDLTGPLDIFNILSLHPKLAGMSLTLIAETIDPVPVKLITPKGADWKFDLEAAMPPGTQINPGFNQFLSPHTTFDAYLKATQDNKLSDGESSPLKPVDVLLIPGGLGTRVQRIHTDGSHSLNTQTLVDFTRKVAPHVRTAIITVCTGADVLAQTGLLKSRRATTNMSRFTEISERTPSVKWVHGARWVKSPRSDANQTESSANVEIWTSAGISAGMDVTLAFIAEYYGGLEVARDLAKRLEYDWKEIEEGGKDPMYEKYFGIK